jgi:heterodisulfide reductase subunit C
LNSGPKLGPADASPLEDAPPAPLHPELRWAGSLKDDGPLHVERCHQCRKCTSGCLLTVAMDVMPDQMVRLVQLGCREAALGSRTIWVCASCQACTARCPNGIEIAGLMDALRRQCTRTGTVPAEPRVPVFHQKFLRSVQRHGRVFELGMTGGFKLATGDLLGDAGLGWWLIRRRKLRLLPRRIRRAGRKAVRALFRAETPKE